MQPAAADLRDPFSTPKDERNLRKTLKGILDWRDYFQALGEERHTVARNGRRFMTQIAKMVNLALSLDLGDHAACNITTQLTQMGTTLSEGFHSKCTPLAVLMSINTIFSLRSDARHWPGLAATLNFLLHLAIESLCESNPALRLLREVIHGKCTAGFLANVYELGCGIIERSPGAMSIFRPRDVDRFRRKFVQGAIQLGMDTAFTFHFHDLWLATCERRSTPGCKAYYDRAGVLYDMGHLEMSDQLSSRCLTTLQEEGNEASALAFEAWIVFSFSQHKQRNHRGAKSSLRGCFEVIRARASAPEAWVSDKLCVEVQERVYDLHRAYNNMGMREHRQALRLEFPAAFDQDCL